MDCAETLKLIAGERGEDLDERASDALAVHLDTCDACRRALGAAEAELVPLGERLEPPEPTVEAWARVTAAVEAQVREGVVVPFPGARAGKAGQRSFPLYLAVAAAVLLALGAGLLVPLEPLFGPASGTTATLAPQSPAQPATPLPGVDDEEPLAPAPEVSPGRVLRLEAGPRFQATSFAVDDLLVVTVTERR